MGTCPCREGGGGCGDELNREFFFFCVFCGTLLYLYFYQGSVFRRYLLESGFFFWLSLAFCGAGFAGEYDDLIALLAMSVDDR
jgi:hypothetical protein